MIPESYKELIEKLIQATANKKISWERSSRPTEFSTFIGSGQITTDCWESENDEYYIDLGIWNNNGERIDSLGFPLRSSEGEILKTLYDCVKRSYLRIDETLKDIMDHLNS